MKRTTLPLLSLTLAAGVSAQTPADSLANAAHATANKALQTAKEAQIKAESSLEANETVDNRVKILERQNEISQEEAEARLKVAPTLQSNGSGYYLRSADSAWTFRPRANVRIGANWDANDEKKGTLDQFQAQTIRLGFDATLAKFLEAKLLIDLSKGNAASLQDGYFDVKFASWARARLGKFQTPLGWERAVGTSELAFYDRALPSQIAPNRDIGAQLSGQFAKGAVDYAVGLFNGGPDGSNIDKDVNDDKDAYGRLILQPAKNSGNDWVEGLAFGAAGSFGHHTVLLTSGYKTTAGNTFFAWNSADSSDGAGWRIAPQLSWTASSFSLAGEWILSSEAIRRGTLVSVSGDSIGTGSGNKGVVYQVRKTTTALPTARLGVTAWQVAAGYVLTGEDASFGGVKPRHPFGKDGWGAFEIDLRAAGLSVDDKAFDKGYADSLKSARSALSLGASLNWHLVKGTRLQAGYERTTFEQGATVDPNAKVKAVRDRKPENQVFVVASTGF